MQKKTQNKMKESSTERKNVREEEKWVKPSGWEDEEGRGGKEWKEEKEDFPWTYFINIQTSELRTHKKNYTMSSISMLSLLFSSLLDKQTKITQTDNNMQITANSTRAAEGFGDVPALNLRLGNNYYLILWVEPWSSSLPLIGICPNPPRVDS